MSFNNSPESNSQEDFDFTKSLDTYDPSAKIAELTAKIQSTEKGIRLATQLNDPGRIAEMKKKKADFESSLLILKTELPKSAPVEAQPVAPKRDWEDMVAKLDGDEYDSVSGVVDAKKIDARKNRFDIGQKGV